VKTNSPSSRFKALAQILAQISVAGFILASGTLAPAQVNHSNSLEVHKKCSNQTLTGDYGIQIEGIRNDQDNATLRTLVLSHFNGDGTLTEIDHVVYNGQPSPEEWRPTTGTYSINPDCTGSASIEVAPGLAPLGYHFIVVSEGRKFLLVVDGGAIAGIAYKVNESVNEQ